MSCYHIYIDLSLSFLIKHRIFIFEKQKFNHTLIYDCFAYSTIIWISGSFNAQKYLVIIYDIEFEK